LEEISSIKCAVKERKHNNSTKHCAMKEVCGSDLEIDGCTRTAITTRMPQIADIKKGSGRCAQKNQALKKPQSLKQCNDETKGINSKHTMPLRKAG
jgi:hypothetical protein